jgi:DNA ligase 1
MDLLQYQGNDLRTKPWAQRRAILEALLSANPSSLFEMTTGCSARGCFDLKNSPIRINYPQHRGLVFKQTDSNAASDEHPSIGFFLESPPPSVLAALTAIRFSTSDHALCTFALKNQAGWLPVAHIHHTVPGTMREKIYSLITSHYGHTHTLSPGLLAYISYREVIPSPRSKAGCSLHGTTIAEWILDGRPDQASSLDTLRIPQTPTPPSVSPPTYSPQLLLFDA